MSICLNGEFFQSDLSEFSSMYFHQTIFFVNSFCVNLSQRLGSAQNPEQLNTARHRSGCRLSQTFPNIQLSKTASLTRACASENVHIVKVILMQNMVPRVSSLMNLGVCQVDSPASFRMHTWHEHVHLPPKRAARTAKEITWQASTFPTAQLPL